MARRVEALNTTVGNMMLKVEDGRAFLAGVGIRRRDHGTDASVA
jgi:hypothetical protein